MKGVWITISGASTPALVTDWVMFLLVGGTWAIGTYLLCRVVEMRIRIRGTLGVS
jgi:hypothetical protein